MSGPSDATRNVLWVAIDRFGQQAIGAIVLLVLARLLQPEEFGLVAMITIFISVSQSIADSGMAQALIRKPVITVEDRSTVFWFNLAIAIGLYGIIYIGSPAIARFYDQPALVDLTRVMALAIPFMALGIVQRADLAQRLQFKLEAMATFPAVVLSGAVSVILAWQGYGVWALAVQYVLMALASSLFLWMRVRSEVRFLWRKDVFKEHFGFGYKLMLSGLINTLFQDINKLVIGKAFGAAWLGFYAQGRKLQDLSTKNLINIIQKATYPMLSQSDQGGNLLQAYRKVVLLSSLGILPVVFFLVILAETVVVVLLGERWAPAAELLQISGLAGCLYHLHSINLNVLKVLGRSDLFLKLEILKKVNIVIALAIGVPLGIHGMLWMLVGASVVALFINTWYTERLIGYGFGSQIKDVAQVLLLCLAPVAIMLVARVMVPTASLPGLLSTMVAVILVYGVSIYLIRNEATHWFRYYGTPLIGRFIPR